MELKELDVYIDELTNLQQEFDVKEISDVIESVKNMKVELSTSGIENQKIQLENLIRAYNISMNNLSHIVECKVREQEQSTSGDRKIFNLNCKLTNLKTSYNQILNGAFNSYISKCEASKHEINYKVTGIIALLGVTWILLRFK